MTTIIFDAKKTAAVALAQSTEEARFCLRGVCFEGPLAVATNGHILTCARDDRPALDRPYIIPISKQVLSALKRPAAATFRWCSDDNTIDVLNSNESSIFTQREAREIDGSFPDWRRICSPLKNDDISHGVPHAAAYIKTLADTAAILGDKKGTNPLGIVSDGNAASFVKYHDTGDVFSMLMPCRNHEAPMTAAPEWIKTAAPESAAA
jgi:hypothetical protein